ncbi:MAG: FAD:protein FMN transferase [Candidatus Omnitrophota bacterium]
MKFLYLLPIAFYLLPITFGCQPRVLHKDKQVMMGTFVEVLSPDKDAAAIVFSEIRRVELLLSKYNPESEISRLNKTGKLKASPEIFFILKECERFWKLSAGAFDVSVGPLVDLWGFTTKEYYCPKEAGIREALRLTGFNNIIFNNKDNMIKFKVRGMRIDLGAIAKGYAVDCAVTKLREKGIKSCLINSGGQIHCLGDKFGEPWRVAIKEPRSNRAADGLKLIDKAVSTSGDYEQFFIKGNKRYHHIINPHTGYPADSGILSVTVIADTGLIADALSTSIFILGKVEGLKMAKKIQGVDVRIIEENPD